MEIINQEDTVGRRGKLVGVGEKVEEGDSCGLPWKNCSTHSYSPVFETSQFLQTAIITYPVEKGGIYGREILHSSYPRHDSHRTIN